MKKEFSLSWKASKQTRKQRKYRENAPLHLRHKMIAANLSKDLRKKYSRRAFPLRKNDIVKIMRGKFSGKQGKVSKIDIKKMKVAIEGIQIQKKDGTKVNVFIEPSNLQIQELNLEDKKRIESIKKQNQNINPVKNKVEGKEDASK